MGEAARRKKAGSYPGQSGHRPEVGAKPNIFDFVQQECPHAVHIEDWIARANEFEPQMQLIVTPDDQDAMLAFDMTLRVYGHGVKSYAACRVLSGLNFEFELDDDIAGEAVNFYNRLPNRIRDSHVAKLATKHPELLPLTVVTSADA